MAARNGNREPKRFEDALERLEHIVKELERGDLTLDDSLARFKEGLDLSRACQQQLKAAEDQVKQLLESADGSVTLQPLGEETSGE